MKKFILVSAFIWVNCVSSSAFSALLVKAEDIGDIYQCKHAKSVISIQNTGENPVRLLSITPLRDWDKVLSATDSIQPGATGYVSVDIFSVMDAGNRSHSFKIETDDSNSKNIFAHVRLFGLSVLDEPMPKLNIGVVQAGDTGTDKISLSSEEFPDFKLQKVLEEPDFVDAKILADNKTVEVTAKRNAKWGRNFGILKVSIDSPDQQEAWIQVEMDVHGVIVPSVNPVNLGAIKNDSIQPAVVQLTSAGNEAFTIGKMKFENLQAKATIVSCAGKRKGCEQIQFLVDKDQPTGRIDGKLLVELPKYGQTLPVEITGIMFDKTAKINVLDQQTLNASVAVNRQTTEAQKIDVKEALNHATSVVNELPPPGIGPLLKWQASEEKTVHGYSIFRSTSEDGQFQKISKNLVPVRLEGASTGSVSLYQYRDNTAEPSKTYWYYVGVVYNDGRKQQLTGPQKVVAK